MTTTTRTPFLSQRQASIVSDISGSDMMTVTDDIDTLFMERRRKYSESYREVEAVDATTTSSHNHSHNHSHNPLINTTSTSTHSREMSELKTESEDEFLGTHRLRLHAVDADLDLDLDMDMDVDVDMDVQLKPSPNVSAMKCSFVSDSSAQSPSATATATATTTATARPLLKRSDSFLDSLPVAKAMPELATDALMLRPLDVFATEIVRLAPVLDVASTRRPGRLSVKVFKSRPDTKLGIRLQVSKDGHLQIAKTAALLQGSPLQSGDELLRINGQNVVAWTSCDAANYLRECVGWVTIVVRNTRSYNYDPSLCQASVCKSTPADKLGVSFENTKSQEDGYSPLLISHMNVAGLLGGRSIIRVGDVVESINQIPCAHVDNSTAVSMIRHVPDWVHILVRTSAVEKAEESMSLLEHAAAAHHDLHIEASQFAAAASVSAVRDRDRDHETPLVATELPTEVTSDARDEYTEPALVSVTLHKRTKNEKLGLTLIKVAGTLYIQRLTGFLASESILREGMPLLGLNDRLASRMTAVEATHYLRDRVGTVRILARNPHGNPKYVQAMVFKSASPDAGGLVGISFKGSEGRQLKVCEVRDDGLFVESCLNVGDSILSINGIPCRHARPKDAVQLVRGGAGSSKSNAVVSILAKSKSKTAIVVARLSSHHQSSSSSSNNSNSNINSSTFTSGSSSNAGGRMGRLCRTHS